MKILTLVLAVIVGLRCIDAFAADRERAKFEVRPVLEEGRNQGGERLEFASTRPGAESSLNIGKDILLDSTHVASATVEKDAASGQEHLRLKLTDDGKKKFAATTKANLGKRLAVIVDKKILLAPKIAEEIAGGELLISGAFTGPELQEIAKLFAPK